MKLGLWLWSWDQSSEFSMEITQFYSCEKSVSIKTQHQGDDETLMELCELSLYPGTLRSTLNIIRAYWSVYEMMCVENDLRNGQTVSSSTMTMLCVTYHFWYGIFCQIKILRCVLIHLIHRIWHHVTSGSSPNSKWRWKVNILNRFRTSRQPQQRN